jgi:hypothetical protein
MAYSTAWILPFSATWILHMLMTMRAIEFARAQGLTYVQVSERLSANLATVKSRMRDGLRGLRNCLGVG